VEIEGALIAEEGEVELGDSFGVGEEVDLDDLPVLNGEGARQQAPDPGEFHEVGGRSTEQTRPTDGDAMRITTMTEGPLTSRWTPRSASLGGSIAGTSHRGETCDGEITQAICDPKPTCAIG
jgi:hypothetical protein